ncbi:hypothetical protein HK405_015007 [Cladochytrium tenue]|nr:hypothetical protein HK405_015007 [Cladochytrium tenue]
MPELSQQPQQPNRASDVLDVFESALGSIFDEAPFAVGDRGQRLTLNIETTHESLFHPRPAPTTENAGIANALGHSTLRRHEVELRLPDVADAGNMPLMATFVWQAALVVARIIAAAAPVASALSGQDVRGARVIEFGAGAGLGSIAAGLCGAAEVVATDYPDAGIIAALEENLMRALGPEKRLKASTAGRPPFWQVVPHKWGEPSIRDLVGPVSGVEASRPIYIIMADVLWLSEEHDSLLKDLDMLFSSAYPAPTTALIASGLHTGRDVINSFVSKARRQRFNVSKVGEVYITGQGIQSTEDEFGREQIFVAGSDCEDLTDERVALEKDPSERKRWDLATL